MVANWKSQSSVARNKVAIAKERHAGQGTFQVKTAGTGNRVPAEIWAQSRKRSKQGAIGLSCSGCGTATARNFSRSLKLRVCIRKIHIDQQPNPNGRAAKEVPLVARGKNQRTNRRFDRAAGTEGLSLPIDGAIDGGGAGAYNRAGGKQQMMFAFETPIAPSLNVT